MKILNRHIGRHVLIGTALALLTLVGLDTVWAFAGETADRRGDYGLHESLLYVALTAPRRVYDFLPMAAIVGAMMALGGLAADSEFVALRAAGVSPARITWAILRGGAVLVVFAIAIGEGVAPFSESTAQQMRAFARTQSTAIKARHGVWARDGRDFVSIAGVHPGGELRGVAIYRFDDDFKLRSKTTAARAVFEDDAQGDNQGDNHGDFWMLHDITHVRFDDGEMKITTDTHARWRAQLRPQMLDVLSVKPEQLPVWRLLDYMDYLAANGLDPEPYAFALWGRIFAPFATLVMLFVSAPFVFSSQRATGAGQRVLIGIILGAAFYLLSHIMGRVGQVYDLNPIVSNALPVALFALAGAVALRGVDESARRGKTS